MPPQAIAAVELEATSASCFKRFANIVRGFPRYLRNILFAAQAVRTRDQIRFTIPSLAFPFSLCEVGVPGYICYRFINCKLIPSDVFTLLAALSRSRSWYNNALIESERHGDRQTSRKTAMYRLFSRGTCPSAPTIEYYHRARAVCARQASAVRVSRSTFCVEMVHSPGSTHELIG